MNKLIIDAMFITNKQDFIKYIPTANFSVSDEETEFAPVKPFLEEADIWLRNELVGNDLYNYLLSTTDVELKDATCRVVACTAYFSCIPFVDLIQTPNGFAVVSNANQAPASKERVAKLLDWLQKRLSELTDNLIILIFTNTDCNTEWKKFEGYERLTECLFMTAASLRQYGKRNALRDHLTELHPVLMAYQDRMAKMVSSEYMDYLIDTRRNQSLTPEDFKMIKSLQTILGLYLKNELDYAYSLLETLVNTMTGDLDKYPIYKESQAYQLKIADKYKNKKDNPIFVFNT